MSDNHKRTISVTLALLDEAMCKFDRWARGEKVNSVLYEMRNSLSDDQRSSLADELHEIREILREIRDHLGLERKVETAEKWMQGECSILWTYLVELEERYLRSYGAVPSGLSEYLDPQVALLTQKMRRISDIVAKKQN
jgi:hypothetical protein